MSLNELARQINDNAVAHGFWEEERNFGEMVALMHSELSEALEEHRAGRPAEWTSINGKEVVRADSEDHPGADWVETEADYNREPNTWAGVVAKTEGVAVELADCLIRILDTMHSLGVDIDGVVARKMAYNASRPFKHGKAY